MLVARATDGATGLLPSPRHTRFIKKRVIFSPFAAAISATAFPTPHHGRLGSCSCHAAPPHYSCSCSTRLPRRSLCGSRRCSCSTRPPCCSCRCSCYCSTRFPTAPDAAPGTAPSPCAHLATPTAALAPVPRTRAAAPAPLPALLDAADRCR
jgi:hypothetical protein